VGLLLSPYIVRTLGEERYGIWALMFGLLDYIWFLDMGLNTAVVNFMARSGARGETDEINRVVNTALAYFSGVSLTVIALTIVVSRNVGRIFHVSPTHVHDFASLVQVTGFSWAVFVLLHVFTSCLDGLQRFDLTSRAWMVTLVVRSVGMVGVLAAGYGLVGMGWMAVIGQLLGYLMNCRSFFRLCPSFRFSFDFVKVSTWRSLAGYGVPAFAANSATLVLNQSAPVLIGHYRPVAQVGYYTLPSRLLQYAVDPVSRVGLVTRSNAAELSASGRTASVAPLGMYANRYCFTLFLPLALFLLMYARELFQIWISPEFAAQSAPVVPILVPAIAIVVVGQFNSTSILFGLGAHRPYAYGVMVEAAANLVVLLFVIPRFGIIGAAWTTSVLMLSVRGLYVPWLVCRTLGISIGGYLTAIYMRPLLVALPVWVAAWFVKIRWLAGRSWLELILAAALIAASYLSVAWFACIDKEHRQLIETWLVRSWRAGSLRPKSL
jgi:O-antigen/teichoic acid export membrane protein